jgi:hypothetical protein
MKAMRWSLATMVALLIGVAGCTDTSRKSPSPAPGAAGEVAKSGTYLAYEHTYRIRFDEDVIAARVAVLRAACVGDKEGECSLLSVKQSAGSYPSGEITMRVAPRAVEPLAKLAAEKGRILTAETRADDLSEAVANTSRQRALLEQQRIKFEALQARRDIAVADQLQLARELATIEVALDANEREGTSERRRIESNLLTFVFSVRGDDVDGNRVGRAFHGLWDSFSDGFAEALTLLGYGLPFLLLAFPLALAWRGLWRWVTGRRRGSAAR